MDTYIYNFGQTPISADVHPACGNGKAAILYFHGGGLFYGERSDLPAPYIEAITRRGYHLICLDYLLAPESPLEQIHASVDRAMEWFLSTREKTLGLGKCPFVLFGRSAGAYLALTLAHRLALQGGERPLALMPFYGYHSLSHPFFFNPNSHYCMLPPIRSEGLPDLRGAEPISSAPMDSRFFLYIYARQQGAWLQMLSAGPDEIDRFSVPDGELGLLPPAFLTASTADHDVPFSFSKKLSLKIPGSCFLPVLGLEHDYDRDPGLPESQELYRRCLDWLDAQISSDRRSAV